VCERAARGPAPVLPALKRSLDKSRGLETS
jgi:hypothetical protein